MPSCSLTCLLAILHLVASISEHPKLLLISFDGFRYDALNKTLVPNIYAFAREGAWYVNGVKPQFVTFTSTNHMAMATGLHAESHGIVSNVFYNTTSHLLFPYNASEREEWYHGEPIWVSNEKANGSRRSACLYWPLGDASYPNTKKPTFFKYRTTDEWNRDVDTIVEWFTTKKYPMNFVAWYIGEPDHTLHESGLYNGSFVTVLKKLDNLFGYFVRQFRLHNLYSEVNVILTADHGHAQIDGVNNIMCVRDYIDLSKVIYGEQMIYLRDKSIFHEVYQNLTNAIQRNSFKVKIYTKETLPSRFHYMGMPSLIGDIILSPDVGAEVRFDCKRDMYNRMYDYGRTMLNSSTHGMEPDNPEMRAILVLHGPDIHQQKMITDVPNLIDLYPLMSFLLRIKPAPNNGTLLPFVSVVDISNFEISHLELTCLMVNLFCSVVRLL